jgi:hypothetical protein
MSALGIFLLLSVMIAGRSVYEKTKTLNGPVSMQKISVSVKNHLDAKGSSLLSQKDADRIAEAMDGRLLTHTMQAALPVSFQNNAIEARVIGTDSSYPLFHEVRLKSGGFLTRESGERGETVAVIEEDLAWQLFNTENAVGNQIRLLGRTFRIIGVSAKDRSILAGLSGDGTSNLYIPSQTFSGLDGDAEISHFEVATTDDGTLGRNEDEIAKVLRSIGKNPAAYQIIDYNIERARMEQKPHIVIFTIGFIMILWTLFYIKTMVLQLLSFLKKESDTDYFRDMVRHNISRILQTAGKTVLAILFILGVWQCIRFRFYIDPALVPDELIDLSYYSGLVKESFQKMAANTGYVAPYAELLFDKARLLSGALFFAGFLPGLLLLSAGLSLFRKHSFAADRTFLILGIQLLLWTGILLLLSKVCGLQAAIDMRSFAVFCPFLLAGCVRKRFTRSGAERGSKDRISG